MKQCARCKIVYYSHFRTRCLYCDTLLMSLGESEYKAFLEGKLKGESIAEQLARNRDKEFHQNRQYLIGSYFRIRTFHFLYCFSRNDMKMGKEFKRFWVQPFSASSLLALPWVLVNILDSLTFRGFFNGYCPTCDWKYFGGHAPHDPKECEYGREYTALVREVLSGRIAQTEEDFQKKAVEKVKQGKPSAYFDLCSRKNKYEGVLDVACVWFSCGIIMYLIVVALFPVFMQFYLYLSQH